MDTIALCPDWVVNDDGVARTGVVRIDGSGTGTFAASAQNSDTRVPLPGRVLLPGFVNAHSHAHQRALRGRVERRAERSNLSAAHDDFWTWRTEMYRRTELTDARQLLALARWAYSDMVRAGFTAVGEFHYLHRPRGASPEASTRALVQAAQDVGIKLCLLQTAYARGGFGQPLTPAQTRFSFLNVDAFWDHVMWTHETFPEVTTGVAVHSVRACPESWIREIAARAQGAGLPLHIHAAEQRAEVAACREDTGMTPIEWLDACGALTPNTVLIHATHIEDDDIDIIRRSGAQVCLCPTTERNLADGLCPIRELHVRQVSLSVGTDSHARIDPFAEMRALEDHERLRTERRCVLEGAHLGLAAAILPAATRGGRAALFGADSLPSDDADFIAVRSPPEMRLSGPVMGMDALLLTASPGDVTDVWVKGRRVVEEGEVCGLDRSALYDELARTVFHSH